MNIKTTSRVSEDAYVDYARAGMFIINPIVSVIIYAAVTVGILVTGLLGDIYGTDGYRDTAVYLAMIGLVTGLLLYMYFVIPHSRWKRVAATPKGETYLTFLDKSVHVKTFIGGERRREGAMAYTDFFRFKETKKYFFLYVAQNQALIIDKAALDGGTPDELRGKLREYRSVSYRYIAL